MLKELLGRALKKMSPKARPLSLNNPLALHVGRDPHDADYVAGDPVFLSGSPAAPNAAWCWFQDPRALLVEGDGTGPRILLSSVSLHRDEDGTARGENDLFVWDVEAGSVAPVKLGPPLSADDHNAAALHRRADGSVIAMFSDHGHDTKSYAASSLSVDLLNWSAPHVIEHGAKVSYSNVFRAGEGALFNFTRSVDWNPNFLVSPDNGDGWVYGGRLLRGEGRPYVQYAQGNGLVHLTATEQHPRDYPNSIYHGQFDGRRLLGSDGRVLVEDVAAAGGCPPENLTRVFEGSPDHVAWSADMVVGGDGLPVILFSTRDGDSAAAPGREGLCLRYHYARFDGQSWQVNEMAHAGTRLYAAEADYSGLGAIDPQDISTVVISTNADPVTGHPLISGADGKRHWELFAGETRDGGESWDWRPLTANSSTDNLRPIIPSWSGGRRAILWMRGTYRTYKEWNTQAVGVIEPRD